MAVSTNKRIFYPANSIAIKNNGGALTFTTGHVVHGAQTASIDSNFNLEPVSELGLLETYENVEGIPDVNVSIQKVADGFPPVYLLATVTGTDPTLVGRSNARCSIGLAVYPDTSNFASGTPLSMVACSGMFVNSVSYTFPANGNFTEDVSFVGNDKIWTRAVGTATGTPNYGEPDLATMPVLTWNAHMPAHDSPRATAGVGRSQSFNWAVPALSGGYVADVNGAVDHPDITVLPTEIFGITLSGLNTESVVGEYDTHVESITISTSFNRESINELGRRGPYNRSITFPVDVTSQIVVTSTEGDLVSHTEKGIFGTGTGLCAASNSNLRDRTIRIATCEGIRIYLGVKNRLASVSYGGADAGGGNAKATYNYTNQNIMTVMHQYDPHPSGSVWWANRTTNGYLTD